MKLAVIIKILQITGMRISTAQHYSISDIKGRFSFYCVCSRLEEEQEEEARGRKQGRRDARLHALGEIKRAERTGNGGWRSCGGVSQVTPSSVMCLLPQTAVLALLAFG